jgi:RIO kinase 1
MGSGLEHLLAEGVITEVLGRLQSGKEAEVYVVLFGGRVVAAKVYKDRDHRSFKNNASYKEGRAVRNSRSQRAMDRGSKFGKAASEDAWKSAEADALYKLHAANVRVPTPVLFLDGVLLMELVVDADGNAAKRVIDTTLTAAQANSAYHDMLTQLVGILACDLIHGDLSPYNVLWAAAGPTVIDFPQIVSASHNSSSERFFLRDAENILGHFARIDRSLNSRSGDASEIWNAYRRRELTPEFRPSGRTRPVFANPRPVAPAAGPRTQAQPPMRGQGPPPPRNDSSHGRPPQGPRHGRPATHPVTHDARRGRAPAPEVIVRPRRFPPPSPSPAPSPSPGPASSFSPSSAPRPAGDRPVAASSENADRPQHRRRRRRR